MFESVSQIPVFIFCLFSAIGLMGLLFCILFFASCHNIENGGR